MNNKKYSNSNKIRCKSGVCLLALETGKACADFQASTKPISEMNDMIVFPVYTLDAAISSMDTILEKKAPDQNENLAGFIRHQMLQEDAAIFKDIFTAERELSVQQQPQKSCPVPAGMKCKP
ncbi:MAG: hypothetical protein DI626_08795 [Micavibrio aeruginosavorus]|uniref:Uncharacterized protein n=1 Tax=Micavibrio aeruginosavorus TaxID=349221 RepID=A0A2W4ZN40_9BACT|nr:MAG: hypothetical protein DI626_08795 [Micavibrio aeruginosavorus]